MPDLPAAAVREWDFPRSAASVLLMTRFAAERGVGAEDVLVGTGLAPDVIADPTTQLAARQELAVVRNLARLLSDVPGLGLRIGTRYQVTTFGIFGFAVLSSPTLHDVIAFALRYWDLSFAFGIPTVEVVDDQIHLDLHDDDVPEDVRQLLVERDLAAMYTIMNALLPLPLQIRRMEFRFGEPPYVDAFVEIFGVRPTFDAPANLSTFDTAYLDQSLPQANEQTVAMCEAQCREMVTRRRARTGMAHEVRDRLVRLGGAVDMDDIARELNVSPRTLRRKLDEEGTSYRALLDEVREALAEEMLATGALSVSDVAIRVGYAEASSFIYAFKRWKGVTPTAYLRGQRVSRGA